MIECPCCDREFDSGHAMKVHKANAHNRIEPWEDKTTMEYLYLKKKMSSGEIAEVLPCNKGHVKRWLRRHGIERSQSEAAKVRYRTDLPHHRWHNGYEQVVTQIDGDQKGVQIHRLLAVAEHGFDAVAEKVVHHKNGVRWDNRPENLEPMTKENHQRMHTTARMNQTPIVDAEVEQ